MNNKKQPTAPQEKATKNAFVAIVGEPNVGKSSLLNRLVGEKVAIVTPKAQTTRNRITGILTEDEIQYVFIDTPGMHDPKNKLSSYMVQQIKDSISDVEVALLLTEPLGEISDTERELIRNLSVREIPIVLVLNKVDTVSPKERLFEKMQAFSKLHAFEHIVPLSALTGEGTEGLMEILASYAVKGPHFFDEDSYTDQPERVIVAEIIREKLLFYLREELPHGVAVEIEAMRERPSGDLTDISAVIYCEKASHKGMIIGKQGAMIKQVSTKARLDIEKFLGTKVNLQTWVRVKEDWRNRDSFMKELGYQS